MIHNGVPKPVVQPSTTLIHIQHIGMGKIKNIGPAGNRLLELNPEGNIKAQKMKNNIQNISHDSCIYKILGIKYRGCTQPVSCLYPINDEI